MLYSVRDENDNEVTDNKLRNECIFASRKDMSYTYFDGVKYHIEKVETERTGFKQIKIKKD